MKLVHWFKIFYQSHKLQQTYWADFSHHLNFLQLKHLQFFLKLLIKYLLLTGR